MRASTGSNFATKCARDLTRLSDSIPIATAARLGPAEVLLPQRKRADRLARHLQDRLGHGGREGRDGFLAHAGDPFVVGLEEPYVDLWRIVRHAGDLVLVEVAFEGASI